MLQQSLIDSVEWLVKCDGSHTSEILAAVFSSLQESLRDERTKTTPSKQRGDREKGDPQMLLLGSLTSSLVRLGCRVTSAREQVATELHDLVLALQSSGGVNGGSLCAVFRALGSGLHGMQLFTPKQVDSMMRVAVEVLRASEAVLLLEHSAADLQPPSALARTQEAATAFAAAGTFLIPLIVSKCPSQAWTSALAKKLFAQDVKTDANTDAKEDAENDDRREAISAQALAWMQQAFWVCTRILKAKGSTGGHALVAVLGISCRMSVCCCIAIEELRGDAVLNLIEGIGTWGTVRDHASGADPERSSMTEATLSAAIDGLALVASLFPIAHGKTSTEALSALCTDERQLECMPLGARERLRQEATAVVCLVLKSRAKYQVAGPHCVAEVVSPCCPICTRYAMSGIEIRCRPTYWRCDSQHGRGFYVLAMRCPAVHSIASALFQDAGNRAGVRPTSRRGAALLLGAIASQVGIPAVTEMVQGLMMEGLQSLPSSLHDLLLQQLTDIALVPPHSHYNTVADFLFTRYNRPFDSSLEVGKMEQRELAKCIEKLATQLSSPPIRRNLSRRILQLFCQVGLAAQVRVFKGGRRPPKNFRDEATRMLGNLLPALAAVLDVDCTVTSKASLWRHDAATSRLFRNLWFYCLLFRLVHEKSRWPVTWTAALKRVARASPTLIIKQSHSYLENELELKDMIGSGLSEQDLAELRQALQDVVPIKYKGLTAKERKLTYAQCVYLLSVYHLERFRAICCVDESEPGGLEAILEYAEAGEGRGGGDTHMLVEGIMSKVLESFFEAAEAAPCSKRRDQGLQDQVCGLLYDVASRVGPRRIAADRALKLLLRRFPQLHWNRKCLFTALDVYERSVWGAKMQLEQCMLQSGINGAMKPTPTSGPGSEKERGQPNADRMEGRLPQHGDGVEGDPTQRHAVLKTVESTVRTWLEHTLGQAPLLTEQRDAMPVERAAAGSPLVVAGALLQVYLEGGERPSSSVGRFSSYSANLIQETMIGVGALAASQQNKSKQVLLWRHWGGWAVHGGIDLAAFSSELREKGCYTGMAVAAVSHALDWTAAKRDKRSAEARAMEQAFSSAVSRLQTYVEQVSERGDSVARDQLFDNHLGTLTAMIVLGCARPEDGLDVTLGGGFAAHGLDGAVLRDDSVLCGVRSAAHAPFAVLGSETMRLATAMWAWVLVACPGWIRRFLVQEICAAFLKSAEDGAGLYGGGRGCGARECIDAWDGCGVDKSPDGGSCGERRRGKRYEVSRVECSAHALCVEVLQEQCRVTSRTSESIVTHVAAMLTASLADCRRLELQPHSSDAYLQTLRLALMVVQDSVVSPSEAAILLDRALRAGLHLFCSSPSWAGESRAPGSSNRPGVCRSRGNWIVAPSWVGTHRATEASRVTQVHVLIQLGVCLQLLFKSPIEQSVFATSRAWSGPPGAEQALAGKDRAIAATANSTSSGGELASMRAAEELWRISAMSVDIGSEGSGRQRQNDGSTIATSERNSARQNIASPAPREDRDGVVVESMEDVLLARARLLVLFIGSQVRRMSVWHNPRNVLAESSLLEKPFVAEHGASVGWNQHVHAAWAAHPRLAFMLYLRYPYSPVLQQIERCALNDPGALLSVGGAAQHLSFILLASLHPSQLPRLALSPRLPPTLALSLLSLRRPLPIPLVAYVIQCLWHAPLASVVDCLPQLLQAAFRMDASGMLLECLEGLARKNDQILRTLFWLAKAEFAVEDKARPPLSGGTWTYNTSSAAAAKERKSKAALNAAHASAGQGGGQPGSGVSELAVREVCERLVGRLLDDADSGVREGIRVMEGFVGELVRVGEVLRTVEAGSRERALVSGLRAMSLARDSRAYHPTAGPDWFIGDIDYDDGQAVRNSNKPLAAVPFGDGYWVRFRVARRVGAGSSVDENDATKTGLSEGVGGEAPLVFALENRGADAEQEWQASCIVMLNHDCRQDLLAVQMVKAIKEAFISERVEAFVQPLAVIPLGKDRGIIEVNPSAKTRDQLCMASGGNLQQHLVQSFGPVHSEEYQKARTCYVQSLAGCCLVSFLLQVKDRSGANTLIDATAHLSYVDFSSILESPPSAQSSAIGGFKLTQEAMEVMGGSPNAEPFKYFCSLMVRSFLAVRSHMDRIVALVALMAESGTPGIRKEAVESLRARFLPHKTEREAAQFMLERVKESHEQVGSSGTDMCVCCGKELCPPVPKPLSIPIA